MPFRSWYRCSIVTAFVAVAGILSAQSPPQPDTTPDLLRRGEQLFAIHCGGCHGPQGQGGLGPDLRNPNLSHAPDGDAMFGIISDGIPGTEMPRLRQLHAQEIWSVVSYVETLSANELRPISGNPSRGRDLYFGQGNCSACHWLNGAGGRSGPDLTRIGLLRGAANLRESLVEPSAKLPLRFQIVSTSRSNGTTVRGLRINEDPFTIQIRDSADAIHSLLKSELLSLDRTVGVSSMPSYRDQLSADQLDDLVAFLATQRDSENKH